MSDTKPFEWADLLHDPEQAWQSLSLLWQQRVRFTRDRQIELLTDLRRVLASKVNTLEAFTLFTDIYDGPTQTVCESVIASLNEGQSMADGLTGWFDNAVILGLRIGEENGVLDKALVNTIDYLKVSKAGGISLFLGRAAYPLSLLMGAGFIAAVVENKFYSVMLNVKPLAEWPVESQFIYTAWHAILGWWWVGLFVILLIGIFIKVQVTHYTGDHRSTLDGLPVFRQYRLKQTALLLKVLGMMLANGIPLQRALDELQRSANPYLRWHLQRMQVKIRRGHGNEADILNSGLIPPSFIKRLQVLAGANSFEEAMQDMGDQALSIVESRLVLSATLFKNFVFVIAGIAMGSVFVSSILLSQSIG